jgi:hypothetical protein
LTTPNFDSEFLSNSGMFYSLTISCEREESFRDASRRTMSLNAQPLSEGLVDNFSKIVRDLSISISKEKASVLQSLSQIAGKLFTRISRI